MPPSLSTLLHISIVLTCCIHVLLCLDLSFSLVRARPGCPILHPIRWPCRSHSCPSSTFLALLLLRRFMIRHDCPRVFMTHAQYDVHVRFPHPCAFLCILDVALLVFAWALALPISRHRSSALLLSWPGCASSLLSRLVDPCSNILHVSLHT